MAATMFPFPPPAPVIPAPAMVGRLQFMSVGAANFAAELDFIGSHLPRYHYIAIDTEYPGTVHGKPVGATLTLANIDELPALQLRLSIRNEDGNHPSVIDDDGSTLQLAWEFNFSEFDIPSSLHSANSVHFLRAQSFNFHHVHDIP